MRLGTLLSLSLLACANPKPTATTPPPAPPIGDAHDAHDAHVAIATPPVVAPVAPAHATKVRTVEGITEYKLGNGMAVLLFPDATQSNVTVNVTYSVGSRHEGYGETGMAHLIEHMMFKGTKRLREISTLLDARGAQSNASTDYDRTNYFETFPAQADNLDWVLEMEADRMVNSTFLESDLASEFSVVRNEFESGENDPETILTERILSTAYLWHNYGKSVIGSRSDIERVPAPTLRAFYAKFYQPDTATLIVAGKLDEQKTLAKIEQTFGAVPTATRVLPATYSVEPVQDGEREVTLRRAGDVSVVGMAWHGVAGTSPDHAALHAAIDILTHQPSGRLYKKLVESKLAASVAGDAPSNHDPQVALISAEIRDPKNVARVEQIMRDEVEGLAATKIDDKEVERWRAGQQKQLELTMVDSRRLALELSEFIAQGDWRTIFAYRERVAKVTAADVARVAKLYLVSSNRTTGRFLPTPASLRAPLTETPDIADVVKGIDGGEVKDQGEAFVATPETLEARTTRTDLKGGIKAAFLPKKTRGGKVQLVLDLHFGDDKSLQGKRAIAELAGAMLGRGTVKRSFQELQDAEDLLKARITVGSDASSLAIHIETLRDKLGPALELAAEMVMAPSFPAKELELVKQEQLAALQQQLQDPGALATINARQIGHPWPKADPRYTPTVQEQIDEVQKVSLADIKTFYAAYVGGGHGELAVVGDFDPAAIGAQTERLFGGWASKKPYARLVDKAFGVGGQAKTIDVKDKENAQLVVEQDVAMRDTDPDYAAWIVLGQVLGGDNASRVWQRLREKGGLSYGAYAWTFADAQDEVGGVGAEAIVAPQNAAKAKAALVEELAKLATSSFTKAEVEEAKISHLKSEETEWSSDRSVLGTLARGLVIGRTYKHSTELRAKISAVTVADVERVAKKYIHPERLIVIEVGDQAKAKAARP